MKYTAVRNIGIITIKKLRNLIQEENLKEGDSIRFGIYEFNKLVLEYRSNYKTKMTNPFTISGVEIIGDNGGGVPMNHVAINSGIGE